MKQQQEQKKWIGAGRFDKLKSTFRHNIYMDNGNPDPIPGYSKGLLQDKEPADKISVLQNVIVRLTKRGYLFGTTQHYGHRTKRMEFFINGNYTGQADEWIFTLFPDGFEFSDNPDFALNKEFRTFLDRLYEQAKTGNFVTKSLIKKQRTVSEKELFDVNKRNHKSAYELLLFCDRRKQDGYAEGQVDHYYREYMRKYFSK